MDDFPSNSRKAANATPRIEMPDESPVKLERVVTDGVIKRKKSLGRRLKETFFSGSSDSVIGYLAKDVLIPALQDLLTDFVKQGIEKAVYGEVQSSRTVRGSSARVREHVGYNRISTGRSAIARSEPTPVRRSISQPSSYLIEEVVVRDKIQVQLIANRLLETLEEYEAVTVANLNELLGDTSTVTDYKWGWTDLSTMAVKAVSGGYLLLMPEPENLR